MKKKTRKLRWIGHTFSKPPTTITLQTITWNPLGKGRRGRPRNTWQKDTERETKEMGYTRREVERLATGRKQWRSMFDGLCSQRANMHKEEICDTAPTGDRVVKKYYFVLVESLTITIRTCISCM